jgi:Ssp1 endopeptidase immunity protein Rap1a
MKKACILTIAACVSTTALAEPSIQMVEMRELLRWCADGSPAGAAACTAYIMGIADAVTEPSAVSCPKTATREQIREAVIRDIITNQPPGLSLPAVAPVTVALRRAFPCR